MAKTKEQQILDVQEQMRELKNKEKMLRQKQKAEVKKERSKRIFNRGELIEDLLPETMTLTEDQFRFLIEKTLLTSFSKRILKELEINNQKQFEIPVESVSSLDIN